VQYCPGGHELQQITVNLSNFVICDVCGDGIRRNCVTARCFACDFDVCESCYEELPGAVTHYQTVTVTVNSAVN
jgi:hypothetical protein